MSFEVSKSGQIIILIALILLAVFQSFDTSITNLSIQYIAGDLHLSSVICNWINTVYTIGYSVSLLSTGWLCKQIGEVKLIKIAIFSFFISSLICTASANVAMLITGRLFLGLTVGLSFPLLITLLIQLFPPEKKAFIVSSFFTLSIMAPFVAPLIGGFLSQEYSWRLMFAINLPISIFAYYIVSTRLRAIETPIEKTSFDLSGFILLFFSVSMIKILVDKGNQYDWFEHPLINLMALLGVFGLLYLALRETTCEKPILNFSFFKEPQYALGAILVINGYIVIYGVVVLIPHLLFTYLKFMPINAGSTLLPIVFLPALFFFPIERILKNNKPYYLMLMFSVLMGSLVFVLSFLTSAVSQQYLQIIYGLMGLPVSLFLPPLVSFAIEKIEQENLAPALSLFVFLRTFSAGLSSSLILYLWDRRIIFHKFRLIESVTLAHNGAHLKSHLFDQELMQQAAILATNDLFRIFSYMMVFSCLITVIYKKDSFKKKLRALFEKKEAPKPNMTSE
jgi:MFS transporter, DHA2 family, multidrug resistance protein